jgi:hypothetical protein
VLINLKRLTTNYVESEDRIRIAAESEDGEAVVLWITHRLARRAVPGIVHWLDTNVSPSGVPDSDKGNVLQSFAQEAAVAGLKSVEPVTTPPKAQTWLTQSLEIKATKNSMTLTFRGPQDQSAAVRFGATELRQWLSILHRCWLEAEWSPVVWPDWIKRENPTQQQIVLH